uniref:C3H1-type domain-containing protein n=1 Tax=Panagrolaimus sp. JU765 TaxID=591449 RepID=A0AC34Q862_9BILA
MVVNNETKHKLGIRARTFRFKVLSDVKNQTSNRGKISRNRPKSFRSFDRATKDLLIKRKDKQEIVENYSAKKPKSLLGKPPELCGYCKKPGHKIQICPKNLKKRR